MGVSGSRQTNAEDGMRGVVAALLALTLAAGVSACNTAEGFGKDLQSAGSALEEEAEENQ